MKRQDQLLRKTSLRSLKQVNGSSYHRIQSTHDLCCACTVEALSSPDTPKHRICQHRCARHYCALSNSSATCKRAAGAQTGPRLGRGACGRCNECRRRCCHARTCPGAPPAPRRRGFGPAPSSSSSHLPPPQQRQLRTRSAQPTGLAGAWSSRSSPPPRRRWCSGQAAAQPALLTAFQMQQGRSRSISRRARVPWRCCGSCTFQRGSPPP